MRELGKFSTLITGRHPRRLGLRKYSFGFLHGTEPELTKHKDPGELVMSHVRSMMLSNRLLLGHLDEILPVSPHSSLPVGD